MRCVLSFVVETVVRLFGVRDGPWVRRVFVCKQFSAVGERVCINGEVLHAR